MSILPCSPSKLHHFNAFLQTFRPPHEGWSLDNILHFSILSYLLERIVGEAPLKQTQTPVLELHGWEIFQTLIRIPHNTHSINSLISSSTDLSLTQNRLGLGLFPVASSLNHSCVPNAFVKFTRELDSNQSKFPYCLELIACTDISPGQELTISYGPTAQQSLLFRNEILCDQYRFLCQCECCVQQRQRAVVERAGREDKGEASKGEKNREVNGVSQESQGVLRKRLFAMKSQMEACLQSQDSHSPSQRISSILCQIQAECLEILREYHSVIERLVPCSCEIEECLCLCYDILGHLSATLSEYQQGIHWIEKAIEIMINPLTSVSERKGYETNDIVILREQMKVIQMLYLGERWRDCDCLATEVQNEMKPFVDCQCDQDYCELQRIIHFLGTIPGVGRGGGGGSALS
jgi:hypothetical protein